MKRNRPTENGLSLIEMCLVVAIALVLTAITVPKFNTYLQSTNTAGDAEVIAQQLALAKMRAAANFTQYQVNFGTVSGNSIVKNSAVCTPNPGASGCYQMQACNANGAANTFCGASNFVNTVNNGTGTPTVVLPEVSLHPGVSFSYGSLGVPATAQALAGLSAPTQYGQIIFNSRGIPIDTTNTPTAKYAVYLNDTQGRQYAVTVNSSGRILVQQYQGGTWVCLGKACQ